MIWTPHFVIGHIGRTGGDAAKIIIHYTLRYGGESHELEPNLRFTGLFDADKHRPFDGTEPMRVLSFRRLPAFILSIRQHHKVYARVDLGDGEACSYLTNGDDELRRFTADGTWSVDKWLRCEYLRDDICALLTEIYRERFNNKMKAVLYSAETKATVPYNHNVFDFFTSKQLYRLYEKNPRWAEIEYRLYGSTFKL